LPWFQTPTLVDAIHKRVTWRRSFRIN